MFCICVKASFACGIGEGQPFKGNSFVLQNVQLHIDCRVLIAIFNSLSRLTNLLPRVVSMTTGIQKQ